MKLSEIIRAVQSDLPITMKHEQWLTKNSNPVYSKDALEFAREALAGTFQNRKRMRFRASSVGMCQRKRTFAALGMQEPQTIDSKLANIFHTGNFLHLKWQMAGITAGWLRAAEVALDKPEINFGGTLDGVLEDGSGFEFKTINSRGHTFTWKDPKPIHVRQVHSYMYLNPEIDKFSIVYENKDTAEWRELRVNKDPEIIKNIDREIMHLNQAWEEQKLPPVLDQCAQRTGTEYRNCPFRDVCLTIKKWPKVINGKVI